MWNDQRSASWGCVTGRFQPFHRDHLELVRQAAEHHGRVIIGITNGDVRARRATPEAPHRHLTEANPFSYWQRLEMILAATAELVPVPVRVTPFPMHDLEVSGQYVPAETECWVRIRGPWEARKADELALLFPVRRLDPLPSEVSGTEIRRRLAVGDPRWRDDVPAGVATLIDGWIKHGDVHFPAGGPLP
jgi:cytidyltransferase-like protein